MRLSGAKRRRHMSQRHALPGLLNNNNVLSCKELVSTKAPQSFTISKQLSSACTQPFTMQISMFPINKTEQKQNGLLLCFTPRKRFSSTNTCNTQSYYVAQAMKSGLMLSQQHMHVIGHDHIVAEREMLAVEVVHGF